MEGRYKIWLRAQRKDVKPVLVQKNFGKSSLAAATESDIPSNSEYLGECFEFQSISDIEW